MRRVMVRYTVRSDRADENVGYVKAVYAQLAAEQPTGLRYATFVLPDGVSFVHLATVEAADNPLVKLAAFQAFIAKIVDRCVEPPVTVELTEVGAYRFA